VLVGGLLLVTSSIVVNCAGTPIYFLERGKTEVVARYRDGDDRIIDELTQEEFTCEEVRGQRICDWVLLKHTKLLETVRQRDECLGNVN